MANPPSTGWFLTSTVIEDFVVTSTAVGNDADCLDREIGFDIDRLSDREVLRSGSTLRDGNGE